MPAEFRRRFGLRFKYAHRILAATRQTRDGQYCRCLLLAPIGSAEAGIASGDDAEVDGAKDAPNDTSRADDAILPLSAMRRGATGHAKSLYLSALAMPHRRRCCLLRCRFITSLADAR